MPTVTSIAPQKKNSKRFNLFVDGKFAFGIDDDPIVNYKLTVGKVLDDEDLKKLAFETEAKKWMERMYKLFSIRQRSEKEVRDYFKAKSLDSKLKGKEQISNLIVEFIVDRLKRNGLLNDFEFARAWVESRRKSKNKGLIAIKSELIEKGISRDIIEQIIEDKEFVSEEEELGSFALQKKLKVWNNISKTEKIKKAKRYLLRKGFSYEVVSQVVAKILNKR